MHNTQSCHQDLSSKANEKASTIKAKALKFSTAKAETLKVESKFLVKVPGLSVHYRKK